MWWAVDMNTEPIVSGTNPSPTGPAVPEPTELAPTHEPTEPAAPTPAEPPGPSSNWHDWLI